MIKQVTFSVLGALIGSIGVAQAHEPAANAPAATPSSFAAELAALPQPSGRGQDVHAKKFCGSCHGTHGLSQTANWPHVAGQPVEVTLKALLDYRADRRNTNPQSVLMATAVKQLSDQQLVDVAHWYAGLSGPNGTELKVGKRAVKTEAARPDAAAIERLVRVGDAARGITPCAACHGTTGKGNVNGKVPVLHGQNPTYFATTLKEYRDNKRTSDIYKEMRFFAQSLTDAEIDALARYYGELKGKTGERGK